MRRVAARSLWLPLLLTFACSGPTSQAGTALEPDTTGLRPTVILVSLDAFRADYLDRGVTPNLSTLAAGGVRARALVPSFPSKTFPNHYTEVTGLYPGHHGIVANNMFDPATGARFSLGDRSAVTDGSWWGGEPIWVTATRRGVPTAPYFWPGSEAAIQGVRPTYWVPFDASVSRDERLGRLLGLLDLPPARRPVFLTLYFSDADRAGHRWGPNSAQIDSTLAELDASIGELLDGLRARGLLDRVNLILTSDHGMSAVDTSRVIFLDDYLDLTTVDVVDWSPVLSLWPHAGEEDHAFAALAGAHPRLSVYRKADIPARFHYSGHRRVPPILGVADPGWNIGTHVFFDVNPSFYQGGNHGYDNLAPEMAGLFVASGPAFRQGLLAAPFQNVHVYPLVMQILGLRAAPGDGSLDSVRALLAP
ncbi:MAG: ectonucleotide pyrophosphatase/phosphodiesterase [Gemmatimonadota bacterium]